MSLSSFYADIIERRLSDGAAIIFDDPVRRAPADHRLSPRGLELAETAADLNMSRIELIALRKLVQRATAEAIERLDREMVVVYTLNEQRTRIRSIEYTLLAKAASIIGVVPGDMLELDGFFGGLMISGRYVIVSERRIAQGLERYRPEDLLNGLVSESAAA